MIVATFTAKFGRRCNRCPRRIRQGQFVYRLANGWHVCKLCAKDLEPC